MRPFISPMDDQYVPEGLAKTHQTSHIFYGRQVSTELLKLDLTYMDVKSEPEGLVRPVIFCADG